MTSETIRNKYPALLRKFDGKALIYFDNACTVLKPRPVIKATSDYYAGLGACAGDRSSHRLSWMVQELIEESREAARRFLNAASAQEIIWTKNSTEGINLVASSFPFAKTKNEVVVTSLEHHSNLLPFCEQGRRRHFKVRFARPETSGGLDIDSLKNCITNKTALVAVSRVSNVTGLINPIKEIVAIAHKAGARVLVDDAQYVATHKEDVRADDVDFLVFSGHKIGGPTGIGVLYVKGPFIKALLPYQVGGGTVRNVDIRRGRSEIRYLPSVSRFEAGVQNYAGIIGLKAAIDFLQDIRRKHDIDRHVRELGAYAAGQLSGVKGVALLAKYKAQGPGSIVSFYLTSKSNSLYDFNLFINHALKNHFIAVRCGHHCAQPLHTALKVPATMRLSFFVYNTKQEIDIFLKALKEFIDRGRP